MSDFGEYTAEGSQTVLDGGLVMPKPSASLNLLSLPDPTHPESSLRVLLCFVAFREQIDLGDAASWGVRSAIARVDQVFALP